MDHSASCPACGLATDDLAAHTQLVHSIALDDLEQKLAAGERSHASKLEESLRRMGLAHAGDLGDLHIIRRDRGGYL